MVGRGVEEGGRRRREGSKDMAEAAHPKKLQICRTTTYTDPSKPKKAPNQIQPIINRSQTKTPLLTWAR